MIVTTLTKRLAEQISDYYRDVGIKVRYLHSDIDTVERVELLKDLRKGVIDVLVGINLLREGLDLPEVSLVAILDADKEGFLRSTSSLIQTIGRAARHLEGKAILYADKITDSMKRAIDETDRRRVIQVEFNKTHGITPKGIQKKIEEILDIEQTVTHPDGETILSEDDKFEFLKLSPYEVDKKMKHLKKEMLAYSDALEFEKAAKIRDQIHELEAVLRER